MELFIKSIGNVTWEIKHVSYIVYIVSSCRVELYPWELKGMRQVQVPYQVPVDFFQPTSISKIIHYVFPKCAIKKLAHISPSDMLALRVCVWVYSCARIFVWGLWLLTTWIEWPLAPVPGMLLRLPTALMRNPNFLHRLYSSLSIQKRSLPPIFAITMKWQSLKVI